MKKFCIVFFTLSFLLYPGCNFSPLSPSNKPNIRNNGEIGDIKNNQNGMMAEIMTLKNKLDLVARDVENLQNGIINSNNKNSGIQIFQGDGGLAVGLSIISILIILVFNYKFKSDKYKKTAEIFGNQIKQLKNNAIENKIFSMALEKNVEKNVYKILKS